MKVLASMFRFLVFSNIFIAACVLSFTVKTSLLMFHNSGDIHVNALVFFATLFLYSFHLLYGRNKMTPEEHKEERHNWVDKHKKLHRCIVIISLIISLSQLAYMPMRAWIVLGPVAIMALGYSIPLLKTKHGWKRFRDIAWLKVLWIALAYAWLTTLLPVIYNPDIHQWFRADVLLIFIRNFLFVFAIAIPFDVRDIGFDLERGVRTLPVVLGINGALALANGMLICFAAIVFLQCEFFDLSITVAFALCISVISSIFIVSMSKPERPNLFFQVVVDSTMVVQFLLVLIAVRYF
jgi:4-hydroxybenzoate polyprenyltransferase